MTAYEVSISKLAAYENAENFDIEEEFNLMELRTPDYERIYED